MKIPRLESALREIATSGLWFAMAICGIWAAHQLSLALLGGAFENYPWSLAWPVSILRILGAIESVDLPHDGRITLFALPWVAMAMWVTTRRLGHLRLAKLWALLLLVPYLGPLFVILLVVLPSPDGATRNGVAVVQLPSDHWLISALISALVVSPMAIAAVYFSATVLATYGWTLFVVSPLLLGLVAALLHSRRTRRSLFEQICVALAAAGFTGVGLVIGLLEGLICLAMAAPLAGGLAMVGGVLGYVIQEPLWSRRFGLLRVFALIAVLPLLMRAEAATAPEATLFAVTTTIEIDAPPEVVWRNVVSFSELPPPDDPLFGTGIAYPLRATIVGERVGAVRYCVFSTGAFVEPIEVWDEPHLLRFTVVETPEPMVELNPFGEVRAAHLDGFMVSKRGQFLLEELPGGATRLSGTTWYQHGLWPAHYWRLWSNPILHRIHRRVLNHIQNLSEAETRS